MLPEADTAPWDTVGFQLGARAGPRTWEVRVPNKASGLPLGSGKAEMPQGRAVVLPVSSSCARQWSHSDPGGQAGGPSSLRATWDHEPLSGSDLRL